MTDEPREDDETLDALRRAFEALPAPQPVRELEAEDADTRRVVAWMAAAWSAQTPETSAPPVARQPREVGWRQLVAWRPLAAAALLLLLLGGSLLVVQAWGPRATTAPEEPVARVAPAETPPQVTPELTPPEPTGHGVVAAADDHLELRSGPVRLLLFLDAPPMTSEEAR